ncbi:MAG: 5'/3'-nucleotidase SurE [Phycisphaerales bacterium]
MRILLTNDDGIRAPGIVSLYDALMDTIPGREGTLGGPITIAGTPVETIYTVAPATVQSATSHGVTFHEPLMVEPARIRGRMNGAAVDGRPADCVKLALSEIWPGQFGKGTDGKPSRPDLVISGMNAGANCGINVIYSGTVAAAIEAAFLGIPSIAVSLHLGRASTRFDIGAIHARRAIETLLAKGLPRPHEVLNVNVPRCEDPIEDTPEAREKADRQRTSAGLPTNFDQSDTRVTNQGQDTVVHPADPDEKLPIVVCPMNTHGHVDRFEGRVSPGGRAYFWAAAGGMDFQDTEPGSDVDWLFRRAVTVTPLRYDLTDTDAVDRWASATGNDAAVSGHQA